MHIHYLFICKYYFFCFKEFPSNFICMLELSKQFIPGLRLSSDVDGGLILPLDNPFYFHTITLLVVATVSKYIKTGWNTK